MLPGLPKGAEILILRLRSLGDLVLETPAISALNEWRPDLRIFVLAEEKFAGALEGNPAITGLLYSRGFLPTAADMRRHRFRIVFNQHGGPRSALLSAASGATYRVGWKGFQYSFVYNVTVPDAAEFYGKPVIHTVEHRMSQFYCAGLPRSPIPPARVFPQAAAADRVRNILLPHGGRDAPYAVLQPEARTATMRWPAENFAEVARWLREKHGITSIVNLSASGLQAPQVRAALESVAIVPEPLDLRELIALISGARLFIGNDSGPVHLAAAAGTPAVVIYGPTNPVQWRPWQCEHRLVTTGAEFEAVRGDKIVPTSEPRAISSISVDEVRAACADLLGQNSARTCGASRDFNLDRARNG